MAEKGNRSNIEMLILDALMDSDKYGYAITTAIKSNTHSQSEIKQPTLYAYLKKLESKELISSYWGEESNGGRRRYYKLTEKGRSERLALGDQLDFDIEYDDDIALEEASFSPSPSSTRQKAAFPQRKRSVPSDDELDIIAKKLSELENDSMDNKDLKSTDNVSYNNANTDEPTFRHIEFDKPDNLFELPPSVSESEHTAPQKESGIFYMEDFVNEDERSIDLRYQTPNALPKKQKIDSSESIKTHDAPLKEFVTPVLTAEEQKRIDAMYGISVPNSSHKKSQEKVIKESSVQNEKDMSSEPDAVFINDPLSEEENRRMEFLYRSPAPNKEIAEKEPQKKESKEKDYKQVLRDLLGEQIESMPKPDNTVIFTAVEDANGVLSKYSGKTLSELASGFSDDENIKLRVYNNGILNYKPRKVLYPNKLNMTAAMLTTLVTFVELIVLYFISIANVNEYNPAPLLYTGLIACAFPVIFGLILLASPNKKSYRFAKPSFTIILCFIIAAVLVLFVLLINSLILGTNFGSTEELINNIFATCAVALGIPIWSLFRAALYKKFIN